MYIVFEAAEFVVASAFVGGLNEEIVGGSHAPAGARGPRARPYNARARSREAQFDRMREFEEGRIERAEVSERATA